jgi:hypothetical protein
MVLIKNENDSVSNVKYTRKIKMSRCSTELIRVTSKLFISLRGEGRESSQRSFDGYQRYIIKIVKSTKENFLLCVDNIEYSLHLTRNNPFCKLIWQQYFLFSLIRTYTHTGARLIFNYIIHKQPCTHYYNFLRRD